MLKRKCTLFIVFITLFLSTDSLLAITLNGSVQLENKTQATTFKVVINTMTTSISKGQSFSIQLAAEQLYQIMILAEGYYPSYQTFSHYELEELSSQHALNILTLPEISLVKRKQNRVMFAFGGDVMMARRYSSPYFDDPVLINKDNASVGTKALVQQMKPYMTLADLASVNLETQITKQKPQQRAPKSVTFYSPPETLDALQWAGIDYVTLGNNHTFDYLNEGLIATLKHLDKSQLGYSGAGLNQQQALKPYYAKFSDNNYAMLGFVGWKGGFSPHQAAGPTKGGAALGTEGNIIRAVHLASTSGFQTIVQYHGSLEYGEEPSRMTESRLKTAIDHGADLVVAHHPHVTQGFELYKNKLIAYSLGNFIFDQNFQATSLSYVLYVWMDGDTFYRAEIVPIYLKGYIPVPATGMQRNALTKRVETLSRRRNIHFTQSGGHLVLQSNNVPRETEQYKLVFAANETVKDLYRFPVTGSISNVESDKKNVQYRLGENLLNGGDFESYDLFTSDERGWLLSGAEVSKGSAFNGQSAIAVALNNQQPSVVGMQAFRRVFNHANPMTYQAKILNTNSALIAKLYIQFRGNNEKLFDALKTGRKVLLNETIIEPMEGWQNYEVNFNTPRVGYKGYRILLELSPANDNLSNHQVVRLDNISLVQWQAHFDTINTLPQEQSMLGLATHIGLAVAQDSPFEVIISH